MEILVCVRRVPDTSENEIQLNAAGNDIERDDLVYSINEPDNYAVEEALQITAKVGGNVTVVTVGGDDDEEVLRREMAMGASRGVLLSDEAFDGSDGRGIANILKAYVHKGHFDLILTGADLVARPVLAVLGELDREPLEGALVQAGHHALDDQSRDQLQPAEAGGGGGSRGGAGSSAMRLLSEEECGFGRAVRLKDSIFKNSLNI